MGIHFVCHLCSYALHVKDFQAGKRGKCPNCQGSFRIPASDASYSSAVDDGSGNPAVAKVKEALKKGTKSKRATRAKKSSDSISIAVESNSLTRSEPGKLSQPASVVMHKSELKDSPIQPSKAIELPAVLAQALDAKWFVRPPSGGQFGPAPSQLLVSWIAESRVSGDSFLWRDGLAQWQLASELLPELFVNEKPGMAILPLPGLNENSNTDRSEANKNSEICLVGSSSLRSGAVRKKRLQKRRQQLTMIILLASISLILLSILIFVLIFQVAKPLSAAFLDRTTRIGQSEAF